jgi:adenine deaminase
MQYPREIITIQKAKYHQATNGAISNGRMADLNLTGSRSHFVLYFR